MRYSTQKKNLRTQKKCFYQLPKIYLSFRLDYSIYFGSLVQQVAFSMRLMEGFFSSLFDNFYLVSWCLSSHTFFQDSRYQKTIWLILDSHGGFLFLFYFFMRICTDIGYIFAIISSFVFHIMEFFKSKWVNGLNVNKNITRREVKLLFKSFCKQFHKTQLSSNTIF